MTAAKPRRLLTPTGPSLHQRLSQEALSCSYSERELNDLERLHPQLIIEREGAILTAINHGAMVLAYAFESNGSFTDNFESMFNELLPRARKVYGSDTVRFRLAHGSSRPAIEPVLRRLWFEPKKAWFHFSLEKTAGSVKAPSPKGVKFRAGGPGDIDELLAIDRHAFPATLISRTGMLQMLEGTGRVLIAEHSGQPVGFALFDQDTPGTGYLRTLAVLEDARGFGIGAALTLRTAKTVFSEGATRLDLRTDDDNATAIRLYTRLGFKQAGAGRDYERPADPKVIEAMRTESEGTFIKFGKWR